MSPPPRSTAAPAPPQKAKETAWAPAKSFMMTAFMLWMSGSGVHPFSIMMTGYAGAPPLSPPPPPPPPLLCLARPLLTCRRRAVAVYNPINSALNVNKQFKPFADPKADATMRGALLMAKVRAWRAWGLWEGGRGGGGGRPPSRAPTLARLAHTPGHLCRPQPPRDERRAVQDEHDGPAPEHALGLGLLPRRASARPGLHREPNLGAPRPLTPRGVVLCVCILWEATHASLSRSVSLAVSAIGIARPAAGSV